MGKASDKRAARRERFGFPDREERQRRRAGRQRGLALEEAIRSQAIQEGIWLRVSYIRGGKKGRTRSPHWMFQGGWKNQERLLDYWPATGRWWSRKTGKTGTVQDPWEALDVARSLV